MPREPIHDTLYFCSLNFLIATHTAPPGTRHQSNVALSSLYLCIREIRRPPVILPTRTARARTVQTYQVSRVCPFRGQMRKCYLRKLMAKTDGSSLLTMVNELPLP